MNKNEEKKEYELAFLVRGSEGTSAVEKMLNGYGAEITSRRTPAETVFAYPIKKNRQGYFGFFHFKAAPEEAGKITDALKLNPEVLRTLIVVSPVKKAEKARQPRSVSELKSPKAKVVEPAGVGSSVGGVLTNEALEEKLEEILK